MLVKRELAMRKIVILLLGVLLSVWVFPITVQARPILTEKIPAKPQVNSEAAICIDADSGQIYFAKNTAKRMYPASTTKMMTAILALEMGNLNSVATVSENAGYTDEGQDINLSPGDRIRLADLVQAALMHSANDSTVAIGEQVGGTERYFLQMMNIKAFVIGAYKTKYANTNGYSDPNHYTTANDLALIARYGIYQNEKFRKLVNTREGIIKWQSKSGQEKKFDLYNTNRLLHNHEWIDGVKTGTTPLAGNCLVAYGRKEGRNIITVVLNSGNRYGDTMSLFDYAFKGFKRVQVVAKGEQISIANIDIGQEKQVAANSLGSFAITIPAGELNLLKREVQINKSLVAPIQTGEKIGTVRVKYQGKVVYQNDLVAAKNVQKKNILTRLQEKIF